MARLKTLAPAVPSLGPRLRHAPKVADPFYLSPEWRTFIARIRRERGNRCEVLGCQTPTHRVIGDHIVELRDGGAPLDPSNIRLLCQAHHNAKTAAARGRRAARPA